jgi:hypothetical protein
LRFVLAILRSSFLLIDLYIPREAPLSDLFERLPRLAGALPQPPFVVSLILQAYKEISRAEAETDLFQLAALLRHKK